PAPPAGSPAVTPGGPSAQAVVPGANGTCEMTTRSIENPGSPDPDAPFAVWIYEPKGSRSGAVTGGRCDDNKRPAVFIAHGYSNSDPVAYIDLIKHLVSVGNIVIYPSYDFTDGDRATLEASYRVVDAGIVAGVKAAPRI